MLEAEGGRAVTVTGPDGDGESPEFDGDDGTTVTIPGGDIDGSSGGGGLIVNVGGRTVTVPGVSPNEASEGKTVTVGGGRGGSSGVVPLP